MKVLITGNTGFIGTAVIRRLSFEKNVDIHLFSTPASPRRIENDKEVLSAVQGMDTVIHLASLLNYPLQGVDAINRVNAAGTENILKACVRHRVSNFIFASTQAVYANSAGRPGPMRETSKLAAKDIYGESKILAEKLCREYQRASGFSLMILRLASVYGRDSKKGTDIIRDLFDEACRDGRLRVFGEGRRIRDLVHVDDVAEVIVRSIGRSGCLNVGSGRPLSTLEIAKEMGRNMNVPVETDPGRSEDTGFFLDITRLEKEISLKPLGFENGLEKTIREWKEVTYEK